jgi:hypothetical protein
MRIPTFVVVMLAGASVAVAAETDPAMRVVIRVYDSAVMADTDLTSATATATRILDASGVELSWHDCAVALVRNTQHPCAAPLGRNEIAVRLVRLETNRSYHGELPLGYSLVDTATHSGTLATIYTDRVAWLAHAAGVDASLLLGRAVAHEIGHLLLGTNGHSETGLMRRLWSCESLKRDLRRDWLFAPGDSKAMRHAVRLRAVPLLARLGIGD